MQKDFSLKNYNTFHVDVLAKYFCEINNLQELNDILLNENYKNLPVIFLGAGSNSLFTKNFDGVVIKNSINGINVVFEDDYFVYVKAFSGEIWNDFVDYCVNNNFGGVENLSLIPGTVGSSVIGNIGAYGVDISKVVFEVEMLDLSNNSVIKLSNEQCLFGYRDSFFKNKEKGSYFIISVTYKLSKNPVFNIEYSDIKKEIEKLNISDLNIRIISDVISDIRTGKLPDINIFGNAGSFFKNPIITKDSFDRLVSVFPGIVSYKIDNSDDMKISAAWLIESCGFKDIIFNNVGVYKYHALVIINYGGASGFDIYDFSCRIIDDVSKKFDIQLEREVNVF